MASKRHLPRYILAGGFALICVLGVCILVWGGRDHQSYQAKPLKYWFHQLPLTMVRNVGGKQTILMGGKMEALGLKYGSFLEEQEKTEEAIRAIGTNGVPFFLAKLGRHESATQNWIDEHAFRWGLKRRLFDCVEAERAQAVTALIWLSPLPDESLRELIVLSTNADSAIAGSAQYVLSSPKPVPRHSILSETKVSSRSLGP